MTIEVDTITAEILRLADARARAQGETLGAYLQHALPADVVNGKISAEPASVSSQAEAWNSFVIGMTAWSSAHLPPGYIADDSRASAYDDRN